MKKRYDLHGKIRDSLAKGSDLSGHMFEKELDAASSWIWRINDFSESEILKKMPNIVELIRECARLAEEGGLEFLAADFESVAEIVEETLESELESDVGQANTSY